MNLNQAFDINVVNMSGLCRKRMPPAQPSFGSNQSEINGLIRFAN